MFIPTNFSPHLAYFFEPKIDSQTSCCLPGTVVATETFAVLRAIASLEDIGLGRMIACVMLSLGGLAAGITTFFGIITIFAHNPLLHKKTLTSYREFLGIKLANV